MLAGTALGHGSLSVFDRLNLLCDSSVSLFPPSSLQITLGFSPIGGMLQTGARKFPVTYFLVNCTAIDWLHAWQQEAPCSVSRRFTEETQVLFEA